MTFPALLFLFTLGVLLHNAEEALFLPRWSKTAGRFHPPVGALSFRLAVGLVSVVAVLLALDAYHGKPGGWAMHAICAFAVVMVVNALVPHVLATIALNRYAPGLATALLFNVPLGLLLIRRAIDDSLVDPSTLAWWSLGFIAATPVFLWLLFRVTQMLERWIIARRATP